MSLLPSAVILGLAALAAGWLAWRRVSADAEVRRRASQALLVATLVQAVHFGEEAATGFDVRFPALLGLPPMPFAFFVGFNVAWLAAWLVAVPGVRGGRRLAYFAAWFLAIAGVLNGVGHPAFAVAVGGYFPGLVTSPCVAAAAAWLAIRLRRARASAG